jgi:hypothetical protein
VNVKYGKPITIKSILYQLSIKEKNKMEFFEESIRKTKLQFLQMARNEK